MPSSLPPQEQKELGRLLNHVSAIDNGFIPDPAYRPMHKLVPWPAVEVLIYNGEGRFLLSYRDDDFKGWHIPGGFMKPNESFWVACNRNVRKEKIADSVADIRLISAHTWLKGEHPFGYPISLTFACKAVGPVVERSDLKWFKEIPPDVIRENHPVFLKHFQDWLKDAARPSAAVL